MNNPISVPQSGPEHVFGHVCFFCSCETSEKENLRVDRVPLIPGPDRRRIGSSLWEPQFVRAMTQQLCQKNERLIERMACSVRPQSQKNILSENDTTKEVKIYYISVNTYMNQQRKVIC